MLALWALEWPQVYLTHSVLTPWYEDVKLHWGSWLHWDMSPHKPHLTIVACDSADVMQVLDTIPSTFLILIILLIPIQYLQSLQSHVAQTHAVAWKFIIHKKVGGVTTHSFWCLMKSLVLPELSEYPVHTIASVIDYSHYLPQRKITTEVLGLHDHLPFHKPEQYVGLPLSFQRRAQVIGIYKQMNCFCMGLTCMDFLSFLLTECFEGSMPYSPNERIIGCG